MSTHDTFQEIENTFIPLPDGRRLAARIWLPENAEQQAVPAVLEYLPYRKRDGTASRDESTYPVFARAGYAGVRVDIAGTGESDGTFDDEYSPQELQDGVDVIAWIAAQSWCCGAVGMMGISWGGFNSLQIAALQPPALKAVISIGTTVDRYNDDIHYKNGCLLYSNFMWSSVMLCFISRPPDPLLVGDRWRELWLQRLASQPFPLVTWLQHQRRDAFWQHGSIGEDYAAVKTPALVISGWADGYINAPPAAAQHLAMGKAINGPWIHKYPHIAYPHPRMDFHAEALRWWNRWLKGVDNGAGNLPAYRAYLSEAVCPDPFREREAGRWVAEAQWPSPNIQTHTLHLGAKHQLGDAAGDEATLTICSPQDCGTAAGEVFTLKPDAEMPGDQRLDDAGSLCLETAVLDAPLEILGRPNIALRVAIDQALGNLAVRLVDVHPDGTAFRVSWGVINLAHRQGNENPMSMTPGECVDIELALDECGYRFLPGHRVRLSISTAYWPMIMPPPAPVTASITAGVASYLQLPVRGSGDDCEVPEPTDPSPLPAYKNHRPARHQRRVERDLQNQYSRYVVVDDTGEDELPHGLCVRHQHESAWEIGWHDPLSARSHSTYQCWMQRDGWVVRTESYSEWHCDASNYYIRATVKAYEGEELVSEREWNEVIARDYQ